MQTVKMGRSENCNLKYKGQKNKNKDWRNNYKIKNKYKLT